MLRPVLVALFAAATVSAQHTYEVAAPPPPGFDRAAASRDTGEHLRRLIALDTQNPPGNEIIAARYLDAQLHGVPGVETHVLDPGDGRANFVARLSAPHATKRAVLVMGHMDVVGADVSKWTTPPFSPTEHEGYIYGRGAIDDKGMLAGRTMAPDAVVIPFMSTGGTDGAVLRERGIPTYGILPMPLPMDDELRMHGDNERVPVASLGWAAEYLYRVLQTVAAK